MLELPDAGDKKLYWNISIIENDKPWVAIIVPDNDINRKVELYGIENK